MVHAPPPPYTHTQHRGWINPRHPRTDEHLFHPSRPDPPTPHADEPTSGLDSYTANEVMAVVKVQKTSHTHMPYGSHMSASLMHCSS